MGQGHALPNEAQLGCVRTVGVKKKSASSPAVPSFVAAADEFCRLLETKGHPSKQKFIRRVLKSTVALYSAGLDLPDVDPERGYKPGGEWFEKNEGLPLEQQLQLNPHIQERSRRYSSIRVNITRCLGGEVAYQEVFDPLRDKEAITTTLDDDLADIYCDAKEGLSAMAGSKQPSASVVWEWKFGLEWHWGSHAVKAITVLHYLLSNESE